MPKQTKTLSKSADLAKKRAAKPALKKKQAKLSSTSVSKIFEILSAANPAPVTELTYATPFQLLAAVVLSAQATDRSVNLATPALFKAAPTPQAMAKLGEAGITPFIARIGLYKSKARHLAALAEKLLAEHGGEVPNNRAALEALPGVGRKTANVVLNALFGEPVIAVDTHVFRVANRTGLAPGKTPKAVETGLEKVIPKEFLRHAHHWLVLHGRYVCKAVKPVCATCSIRNECSWSEKGK